MLESGNKIGNPYHDKEGKFTSGEGAGKAEPKLERTTEDKLAGMGFGESVKIRNKQNPDYVHEISRDRLANVGDEWEVIEDEEGPKEKEFIVRYEGNTPEDESEIKVDEDEAIDYIRSELEKTNNIFFEKDPDFNSWYDSLDANVDFAEEFKKSPFFDKAENYFDMIVSENEDIANNIRERRAQEHEEVKEERAEEGNDFLKDLSLIK